MCLAVPGRIVEIDASDHSATVDILGVRRKADLALIEDPKEGEYILLHAGFAIERIDEDEALETIELHRQLAETGFQNEET